MISKRIVLFLLFLVVIAINLQCMPRSAYVSITEPPTLTFPPDNYSMMGTDLEFSWHTVQGAERYILYLDDISIYETEYDTDFEVDMTEPPDPSISTYGEHEWYVSARNDFFKFDSEKRIFEIFDF